MSPREQLIRRMMQRQQFARGGPGGFDPFEEQTMGSGAFGLAGGPSLDQEVIPGLDYRDGPADMPFSPSPVGMADPINMEELDAQFAAIQSGANPDMAGAEASSIARQLDQEQTISGFGLDPEDNQGIYDMSDVLMGDTGDNALRPSMGPGTRGPGPDLPGMAPGGDMPLSVGMGNMNPRLTAATELAQKNWMDHHKPENYDSIEEYQQAAFSDGVVNPLYGNQTAEKIKSIYGVKTMPDQDNVAERALHAAATKKREINRDAFEKSLAYFGGSMEEYDKWHKSLPKDKRKAVYDWETALAALQGGEGQEDKQYNAATDLMSMNPEDMMSMNPEDMMSIDPMMGMGSGADPADVLMRPPAPVPDVPSDAGYYSGMDESGMFDSSFEFLTPTLQGPSMAEVEMGYPDMTLTGPSMEEVQMGYPNISEEQAAGMITMPSPEDITMLPRETPEESQMLAGQFGGMDAGDGYVNFVDPNEISIQDQINAIQGRLPSGSTQLTMPSPEDIYVGPNRVGMPSVEDIYVGPNRVGMPAMEDIQIGPRDEMMASMNPEDMMSRYADPAVDAAPDGMFSQETAPLSQIQDQVMAAQSPDAGSTSSTGEKKTRRRRRREPNYPEGYDPSLGYVPLPQLSPELRRAQTRDRLRQMRLQPTAPSPQESQPLFNPGAIPTSDMRRQLLMRQLDKAGTGRY